jgi:hypothetical protein
VPLDFLNDVFLLHLALETAQRILQRFAVLQLYFSQSKNTSQLHPKIPMLEREFPTQNPPTRTGWTRLRRNHSLYIEGTDIIGG